MADWAALHAALAPFRRPFFTLGREPLAHLESIPAGQFWTVRVLDEHPGNARARVIAARGPFGLEAERELFATEGFDVLVSNNSGGAATEAKLQVARERGLPVLVLARPALPAVDCEFASAAELWAKLQHLPEDGGEVGAVEVKPAAQGNRPELTGSSRR